MNPSIISFKNTYLSNFYSCQIEIEGMVFPSSEHAYQSFKSDDPVWKRKCQNLNYSASEIKRLSNLPQHCTRRKDWPKYRLVAMELVLRAKFSQNPSLKRSLIGTKGRELVETNHWNDTFWGVCRGEGENNLGKLLMKIREEL